MLTPTLSRRRNYYSTVESSKSLSIQLIIERTFSSNTDFDSLAELQFQRWSIKMIIYRHTQCCHMQTKQWKCTLHEKKKKNLIGNRIRIYCCSKELMRKLDLYSFWFVNAAHMHYFIFACTWTHEWTKCIFMLVEWHIPIMAYWIVRQFGVELIHGRWVCSFETKLIIYRNH